MEEKLKVKEAGWPVAIIFKTRRVIESLTYDIGSTRNSQTWNKV